MALIDTYRNNVSRKRTELSKLSNDRAKESEKKAKQKQKIVSAMNSLKPHRHNQQYDPKTLKSNVLKRKLHLLIKKLLNWI